MSKEQAGVVEDHSHDRIFVATFLAVLAVLIGIAIVIGIIANSIDGGEGVNPVTVQKTQQRLQPVGGVYTDASQVPAAPVAAAADSRTTEEVVAGVCAACHSSGLLDAPKTGDSAEWQRRIKALGGMDALVASAIDGKGAMPPRGGDAGLSDDQVRAAVLALIK